MEVLLTTEQHELARLLWDALKMAPTLADLVVARAAFMNAPIEVCRAIVRAEVVALRNNQNPAAIANPFDS